MLNYMQETEYSTQETESNIQETESNIQETEYSTQETESNTNIEKLIQLKFSVEREYNSLNNLFTNIENINWVNMSTDLDIYAKLSLYRLSIETTGRQFLEIQQKLINDIDEILMKKCEHNWIEDIIDEPLERSRDICYCSKCYIYTKK